eukprot:CAMPEP_0119545972 /NCGR_PEP_ID=MMETSP1352-20130426/570_1 /TAXON_ID=265584 /ORGANISM="Stauroneis constricta, Strain CCMP1120" /LENGTH=213 /DNA_ID=CAMNT_0007590611 /DNA_START=130 /DNA_END=771 /DNA_ORIENTATION=-
MERLILGLGFCVDEPRWCAHALAQLELSRGLDDDLCASGTASRSDSLDGLDDIHAINDRSEHNVLSIEPCGLGGADEELGSVGVWSGVGHAENSWASVLELEVFIGELSSVDGLSSGSVVVGEITSLAHESWDDAVEDGSSVSVSVLAGAELTEVFGSLWDDVASQFHRDAASWLAADGHIEVDLAHRHDDDEMLVLVLVLRMLSRLRLRRLE